MKTRFTLLNFLLLLSAMGIITFLSCEKDSNDVNILNNRLKAQYGEVVKLSDGSWRGTVDGKVVYTGSRLFDCANAVINNMSDGTVVIKNSGESGPGIGNIYAIKPKSNMTLDFSGCTINCNGDDYIVPVQADNKSNITVKNLKITGRARYGLWFRTCSGLRFENITISTSWGLGIRVDNSKGGPSSNVYMTKINVTSCGDQAVETYGVNGCTITDVTASNVANGCGLLLNQSTNNSIGTVNGYRCNKGGGYAAFRVANNNRTTTCAKVIANECGRGFFSVSGSSNCTVQNVDIKNCTSHGIFLEDASYTYINSGTVTNCNPNVQHVRCSNVRTCVNGQTYTANDGKW